MLRPIAVLRVATAYLAKTSVIAKNVGHSSWEASDPEDVRCSIMSTFHLKQQLWMILLTSIIIVPLVFPMQTSSSVLFSPTQQTLLVHLL